MRYFFFVLMWGGAVMALPVGCNKNEFTIPPNRKTSLTLKEIKESKSFFLLFGTGGDPFGYNILRSDRNGQCKYTFEDETREPGKETRQQVWKSATFVVEKNTLDKLFSLIIDQNIFV